MPKRVMKVKNEYVSIDGIKYYKKDIIDLINRELRTVNYNDKLSDVEEVIDTLCRINNIYCSLTPSDVFGKLTLLKNILEAANLDIKNLKQENDTCADKIREIRGIADASIKTLRENEYKLREQNEELDDKLIEANSRIALYTRLLSKLCDE